MGWAANFSASVCAERQAHCTRGKSVRMPRISSQASVWPRMVPSWARMVRSFAQCASSRAPTSAPAIRSEWPLRYLVAECMTMSAPSSIGRVSTGVATVESTASSAPALCAISAARGDVGDRPGRIGRRLEPDQLGRARPHGGGDGVGLVGVDELDLEAPLRGEGRRASCAATSTSPSARRHDRPGRGRGSRRWPHSCPTRRPAPSAPPSSAASVASAWSKVGLSARA